MAVEAHGRCASCGAHLGAQDRFCSSCGARNETGSSPTAPSASLQIDRVAPTSLGEQRKVVTVMFADLSGSTRLGERLDPEELRGILASYFNELARQIRRYDGTIDKYIGDAVMAVFGAPISHEDDGERAVSAALAMQQAILRLNEELSRRHGVRLALRIGINTGEVVAGLLAGDVQNAYTVVGDAVNTAQRLEAAAGAGEVVVGEITQRLARRAFRFERLEPLTLKGKAEPVVAYRILGRRLEAAADAETALVGRATEYSRLLAFYSTAASGTQQLVHLHGEAGVGKSRLVGELLATLPTDIWRASVRASSYERIQPYALVAGLLRQMFAVQLGDDETSARAAVSEGLGALALRAHDVLVTLCLEVLGYGSPARIEPETKRQQLVDVLHRLLEDRAAHGPFVIVLEDIHWIDQASESVLADELCGTAHLRMMVITTSREERTPWKATAIELRPLDDADAAAMVDRVAGATVDPSVKKLVLDRTAGNPFFIEEVVRDLASRKSTTIPATVQDLLEEKLDALEVEPRRVGQRAAVIGRTFWTRVLERVTPDAAIGSALETLESARFIKPFELIPEERYAFRHALVQEVFYQTQLLSQRREAHGAVARAIEAVFAARIDEFTDILAFHFDRSDDEDKAIAWLTRAGHRAKALFANQEAISSFGRAIERARRDDRFRDRLPTLLVDLADVRALVGDYDEALMLYTEARDLANDVRAWRGMIAMRRNRGSYPEALELVNEAVSALEGRSDLLPLALERAHTLSVQGHFKDAIDAARSAIESVHGRRDPIVAQLLVRLGRSEAVAGLGAEALVHVQEALGISRAQNDISGELAALRVMGDAYLRLGRLDDSADAYGQAQRLAERVGAVAEMAGGLLNLGIVERRRGRLEDAIAWDRRAVEEFDRIRHGSGRATAYGNLASHLMMRGDYEEALRYADVALEIARQIGHRYTVADVYQTIASSRIGLGEVAEGASRAEEAAEVFLQLGARPQAVESLQIAAAAWARAGDDERARAIEARARSLAS